MHQTFCLISSNSSFSVHWFPFSVIIWCASLLVSSCVFISSIITVSSTCYCLILLLFIHEFFLQIRSFKIILYIITKLNFIVIIAIIIVILHIANASVWAASTINWLRISTLSYCCVTYGRNEGHFTSESILSEC